MDVFTRRRNPRLKLQVRATVRRLRMSKFKPTNMGMESERGMTMTMMTRMGTTTNNLSRTLRGCMTEHA